MTATIEIYSFPKVVTLTLGGNTGGSLMNYPINNTDFTLVKGVTNEILFFVKNVDRQPITANSLTNSGIVSLRMTITDHHNNQLLIGGRDAPIPDIFNSSVLVPYTLADPAKGIWVFTVSSNDMADWPLGNLRYSVVGDRIQGDQVMLYTNRSYGPYGSLEVIEGPYPMPPEAIVITPDMMVNTNIVGAATIMTSGSFLGAATVGNISGMHSAVFTLSEFKGGIMVEATLENQPSQNPADWFLANITSSNNGVVDAGIVTFSSPISEAIYLSVLGNYTYVRFTIKPLEGSLTNIAYRNN